MGIWIIIGLIGGGFSHFNKNTTLKRRVMPTLIVFNSLIFIVFIWLADFSYPIIFLAIPVVALITFIVIRNTKFCDSCGTRNYGANMLSPAKFCYKCGAPLK
jgi:hypothetical protein